MILAKVVARVVSTARLESIPARSFLSVEPLPGFGERTKGGQPVELIALDTVSAGPGDLVLVLQEGSGARQALGTEEALPLQMVIVGIVDNVDTGLQ